MSRVFVGSVTGTARRLDTDLLLGTAASDSDDAGSGAAARAGAGAPASEAEGGEEEEDVVDVETLDERLDHDPAFRRRAYKQALYRRRNARAQLDGADPEDQLEDYAAAYVREHGHDIELSDWDELTRADEYRRGTGEDPLERECRRPRDTRGALVLRGCACVQAALLHAGAARRRWLGEHAEAFATRPRLRQSLAPSHGLLQQPLFRGFPLTPFTPCIPPPTLLTPTRPLSLSCVQA